MANPNNSGVEYILTVDEAHLGRLAGIGSELKERGFDEFNILESTGMVIVRCAPSRKAELLTVAGVIAVESSESFSIAPPDSDIQ